MIPIPPAELGTKTQLLMFAQAGKIPDKLRTTGNFINYVGSTTEHIASIKLDDKHIFFTEESPTFSLSGIKNAPPIVKPLTVQQMWDQHALTFFDRRIPDDSAPLSGSEALFSLTAPTMLPMVKVNKTWGLYAHTNYQQTSQVTGFVLRVKDMDNVFCESAPTDLIDMAWNVVKVNVKGVTRGVFVWCDSTKVFPAPW